MPEQDLMVHCDLLWRNRRGRESSSHPRGRSVVDILKSNKQREVEEKKKIQSVREMVEMAVLMGDVKTKPFYVIQTNVFLQTEEYPNPAVILPAEISIARFSLQEGVMEVYQAFPEPGEIPLGYKRICLENSRKGHRVPLEDDSEFVRHSDRKILEDISSFLSGASSVFCLPRYADQCKGVLATLATRQHTTPLTISVLSLPMLLFMLGNSSKVGQTLPSINIAEAELEKEQFMFQPGLSCSWHEAMTDTSECSSATVCRWCFTLLDLCCQHYSILLVSGKHIPRAVEIEPMGTQWYKAMTSSVVRRPGGFASEDVRFKEEGDKQVVGEVDLMPAHMEKVKQEEAADWQQAGTTSDYMGAVTESVSNLSVLSDSSSHLEYVTLDSISQAPSSGPDAAKKGVGRGAVLSRRRQPRIAATFPGMGKE